MTPEERRRADELWLEGATSAYPLDENGEMIIVDAHVWHNIMHFLFMKDK